jgi:short-subunit dehydrogenase
MSLPDPSPDAAVLVTGASAGIGTELARQLAERGHGLMLVARRRERLDELAERLRLEHGVRVEVEACDLADDAERAALVERLDGGDRHVAAVCNNAGFGTYGRFQRLPLERELEEVRLNVLALHHLSGAFLDGMLERASGAILNVASIAGAQPIPGQATYAATKAFVVSFSEALHAELAGTGVSCTALCPGPVRTEFPEVAGMDHIQAPDFVWATADEVARAGIEAMLRGRRTVTPGVTNRIVSTAGRFAPRSLLLPVAGRITSRA